MRWLGVALMLPMALVQALAQQALAQDGVWNQLAPLQEARQEIAVAELEGKLYAIGGFGVGGGTLASAEVYDPATNRWTKLPPLPVGVNHPAAAALGGKVYVLGGYRQGLAQPTQAVQVYDPATNQWSQGTPMPTARGALAAAAVAGRLYAIGGARGGRPVGDTAVYDPATNRWEALAPLPTPREHLGAGVWNNRIYVVGGRDGANFTINQVEVYDPASGRWENASPMLTGRSGHAVAVLGNCLYTFGGEVNRQSPKGVFPQVEAYSFSSKRWSSLGDMPLPRHGQGAVAVGGKIYLVGGATIAGYGAVVALDAFVPPSCG